MFSVTWAYRSRVIAIEECPSCAENAFTFALFTAAAVGLYPYLLPSSTDPARSLTIGNAAAGDTALRAGLLWLVPGLILLAVYEVFIYRTFHGKVVADGES